MAARRALYLALLTWAALLHFAYGQYVTHYLLIFLLLAPVLSAILSLPTVLRSRVLLISGGDVRRGGKTEILVNFDTFGLLPPEAWSVTVIPKNLFTDSVHPKETIRVFGEKRLEKGFTPDTTEVGCIRYKIKSAFVFDYLGLIPIPVRRGGPADVTVLPDEQQPMPEPELVVQSAVAFKPKPQGFSEEHELREYREGDPLNLIHWKLTAKYDGYIVREPQEEVRKPIVLVPDTPVLYIDHLSVLEQLCFINYRLLEKQISYSVIYGRKQIRITSESDYKEFMRSVLSEPMRRERVNVVFNTTADELIYRIRPGKGEYV